MLHHDVHSVRVRVHGVDVHDVRVVLDPHHEVHLEHQQLLVELRVVPRQDLHGAFLARGPALRELDLAERAGAQVLRDLEVVLQRAGRQQVFQARHARTGSRADNPRLAASGGSARGP